MGFANPAYLFALAGMLIPLAIHLWSKKEGRVIRVGSTKFLPEVESKKSSSIRINEILLLILRMLMVALLALILVAPFTKSEADFEEKAAFIDPGLRQNKKVISVIDSLTQSGHSIYWFLPGFPSHESEVDDSVASYWHLIKDLETFEASDLLVISNSRQTKLIGERPALNRDITWMTLNDVEQVAFLVSAAPDADRLLVIAGHSNENATRFSHFYREPKPMVDESITLENYAGSVPVLNDTLLIKIDADEEFQNDKKYIKAALQAISSLTQWSIKLTSDSIAIDWYISLKSNGQQPLVDKRLIYKPDSLAQSLIVKGIARNEYWLTSRLNEENGILEELVTQLFEIIRFSLLDQEDLVVKFDQRVANDAQLQPKKATIGDLKDIIKTSLVAYLWALLIVVLLIERILSMLRKQ